MSLSIFPPHFYWQRMVQRTQQEAGDCQFMRKRQNPPPIFQKHFLPLRLSSAQLQNVRRRKKDDKCWSRWRRRVIWGSRAERRLWMRRGRLGQGGKEGRGGRSGGEERKKSDGTCSFIRPFTPVATATCLEGTPERRRRWQKNNGAGRELVGAAQAVRHSPTRQRPSHQGCSTRRRSRGKRKRGRRGRGRLQTSSRLPLPLSSTHACQGRTLRVLFLSVACNEHSFISRRSRTL